jgi:hypothetical protein
MRMKESVGGTPFERDDLVDEVESDAEPAAGTSSSEASTSTTTTAERGESGVGERTVEAGYPVHLLSRPDNR